MNVTFTLLAETLAIARLDPRAAIPSWATGSFVSITRTSDELSVICSDTNVPDDVTAARGWCALRAEGPFALDATGVAASFVSPLAAAAISTFVTATYDTDYLLVDGVNLDRAIEVLRSSGHVIQRA